MSVMAIALLCAGDANRLYKLIHRANDIAGVELDSLAAVSEKRLLPASHSITGQEHSMQGSHHKAPKK